jgi:hypothetical protein
VILDAVPGDAGQLILIVVPFTGTVQDPSGCGVSVAPVGFVAVIVNWAFGSLLDWGSLSFPLAPLGFP